MSSVELALAATGAVPALSVLYRGPLSSCNYGCAYCPFAKRHEDDAAHAVDAAALERFLDFCRGFPARGFAHQALRVFFTPWGEALTQPRYQEAMIGLSHLAHVDRVAIQTNLSASLAWLPGARVDRIGIWATYHPQWTTRARFLSRCQTLLDLGVSFSVGVVGFPDVVDELRAVRSALPGSIYVWVNAVKALAGTYDGATIAACEEVDPLFPLNLRAHDSLGKACGGGHTVISVDGEGTARSCHFVRAELGNIHDPAFPRALAPRPCPAQRCGCHIGYVHLEHLGLDAVFGEGILERAPRLPLTFRPAPAPATAAADTAGTGAGPRTRSA